MLRFSGVLSVLIIVLIGVGAAEESKTKKI